jgi:hypothetical protein
MILLDKKVYRETKKIALGKIKKSPLVQELSDWFMSQYSVCVLNIEFSKLVRSERYRLYVILENSDDYRKMHKNHLEPKEEYQCQVAVEFGKLALKHKFADESKLQNLFVAYNNFSEEAKTEANSAAVKEAKKYIKKKYPAVWGMIAIFSNSVVFYGSDSDIAVNESNGISKAIADAYYSVLKKYDELNYYTHENISLSFDSKENLDKNYQGSLFYYTR